MKPAALRAARLRAHRLNAPAASISDAASHMLATQAQEFWGGRWALAARTRRDPRLSEVDAAFDRGEIVRSWTMRGTVHIVPPRDLGWVQAITAERQLRQYAVVYRALGIEPSHIARAERAARSALSGGNRVTRREFAEVLAGAGLDTTQARAQHLLIALAIRSVILLGPVVPREGAPTNNQYVVLTEDWVTDAATPADPLAELYVRYLAAHAPAGPADFAWWTGLPLGVARAAAEAAGDRVVEVAEGRYAVAGAEPRRSASAPRVLALPPYEEVYLSYADRTSVAAAEFTATIGPSINGIVRPILVADGEVVGMWSHSVAANRHALPPVPELFAQREELASDVDSALARFSRFITG
ncbi:winged helix DNA-binding domain-containing protein [Microbacterium sp. zg-YB36]|uniref:winged helix DNA-binding domain-containing protein n=1 Tax=Microbacterium sp. zg-YB36 TaxID=2969407 RepID=UPI00214A8E0F|nr:winged helix DNA-binding domain-containing protein [Microbacterium sp. zg-YB36]MDL5352498.1 winged helix DNA-binding domain-containing protein [Microbacterium sp. zg-YB36]